MLSQYGTYTISVPHICYLSTAHMLSQYRTYSIAVPHTCYLSTAHMLSQYRTYTISVPHIGAAYAISVPQVACGHVGAYAKGVLDTTKQARRHVAAYQISVPDIAEHTHRQIRGCVPVAREGWRGS
eukprot:2043766-Rhodomonas_salina.1